MRVVRVAGKHVNVKVPDVLATGGFVVLADRGALTRVRGADADGDSLGEVPHRRAVRWRKVVDVLHMRPRDDKDRARVPTPPLRSDPSVSAFSDSNDVCGQVVLVMRALEESAERAGAASGRMCGGSHAPIIARRAAGCSWNNEHMLARVVAVHSSASHTFSKETRGSISLLEGLGVDGDAHCGATVKHRSRVAADPSQPNLRQVHLIHGELFETLKESGHLVAPGDLGENITTQGIDLLALPVGARLRIGETVVTVTGLRNPCQQINGFQSGLLKQVVRNVGDCKVVRLAGVMGIVSRGGRVAAGDPIDVELPPHPHLPLTRV